MGFFFFFFRIGFLSSVKYTRGTRRRYSTSTADLLHNSGPLHQPTPAPPTRAFLPDPHSRALLFRIIALDARSRNRHPTTSPHSVCDNHSIMATDLVMPQLPAYPQQQTQQQQQQQQRFYSSPQKQQKNAFRAQPQLAYQPAPLPTPYPSATNKTQISPLSTSGSSQTSPKNYTAREESKPYIPAVLRRNEFPPINISTEAELVMQERSDEQPLRPNSSFMSLGGLGALGRLSRRSTGDSAKHVDGSWNLDLFPEPTGAPTRKNWKVWVYLFAHTHNFPCPC